jgi:antibiotic biosynthesis monooxygenase (ABM) superfamily enzyme
VQEERTRVEDPPVAVNVTRRIKPGRVGEFEEWVSGITDAISRFPGYLGCEVLKPGDPSGTEYHIIFKFERLSDLQRWEDSDELRDWCGRVESFQEGQAQRHVVTGLQRWFVLPPSSGAPPPPRYKLVALTLACDLPAYNRRVLLLGRTLAAAAAGDQDAGGHGDNRAGYDLLGDAHLEAPFREVALSERVQRARRRRGLRTSERRISTLTNARPAELPRTS